MKEYFRLVYFCEDEGIIKENFFDSREKAEIEATNKFKASKISYPWIERICGNETEIVFDIFDRENCF